MENKSKQNYTLQFKHITDLKGIACENGEKVGDTILINGIEREIKRVERFKISWFVVSKKLIVQSVEDDSGFMHDVNHFLKSIGFLEKKAFMRRFFVKFDISELRATSCISVGWFINR